MSESKHTPGPWSVPHFAQPDVNCECGYVLVDHMMGAVATVHCSGEGNDWRKHGDNPRFEEAVANAHLIAAAPDLLEALQAIIAADDEFRSSMSPEVEKDPVTRACDAARLVVAKAEGRS